MAQTNQCCLASASAFHLYILHVLVLRHGIAAYVLASLRLSVFECWQANLKGCANTLSNIWLGTQQLHAVVPPSSSQQGRQARQIFASSPNRPTPLAQSASLPQKCAVSPAASPNAAVQCSSWRAHRRASHSRDAARCPRRLHLPQQLGVQLALGVAHGRHGAARLQAGSRGCMGGCAGQGVGGSKDRAGAQVRAVGWLQATTSR